MNSQLDEFYMSKSNPQQGCLLALRDLILAYHPSICKAWKWDLPFFTIKNKNFCYLSLDKKTKQPYVAFLAGYKMHHPQLYQGNRKMVKLFYVNAEQDIDRHTLHEIMNEALKFYES